MKTHNTYHKAIQNLPEHKADADLWLAIEARLSEETELSKLMPRHKADENVWKHIETKLENGNSIYSIKPGLRWAAAAAIILIMLVPLSRIGTKQSDVQWLTSEEVRSTQPSDFNANLNMEQDLMAYCNQSPEVCESPDFNALNTMLDQLKSEKTELIKMSEQLNDPSINEYLNKVNNNIAQVQRKLLSMF